MRKSITSKKKMHRLQEKQYMLLLETRKEKETGDSSKI